MQRITGFLRVPYNPRNESTLKKVDYNEYGYPTCPNNPSLAMKYHGVTKENGRADRIKWGCPMMHYHHGWICDCKNPCSSAVHNSQYPGRQNNLYLYGQAPVRTYSKTGRTRSYQSGLPVVWQGSGIMIFSLFYTVARSTALSRYLISLTASPDCN